MSNWLSHTLDHATPVNDWFAEKRRASFKRLQQLPWPTRKTEAWKYTSVAAIEQSTFVRGIDAADVGVADIPGLNSLDVVVIDGRVRFVPENLPAGLAITPLSEASAGSHEWGFELFAAAKPDHHYFGLVNDALASSGVLIDVEAGCVLKQPVRLVNIITEGRESHCRQLVRLGCDAQATVIEQSAGDAACFNTHFAEYALANRAELEHYRLALETGPSLSISGSHFNLADQSSLTSTLVGFGSTLSRIDIDINHRGEDAKAVLNGIYLLDGEEHFDLHSTIEHEVPNGTTEENIRGIVADKAHAVFNGRIHIHRGAQKVQAELNNRNLLLSREAEVDTRPELEIYADDVRCAHGATIAEIDRSALYYLRSRGVDPDQARLMLNFGFINELLEQVPNHNLARWLNQQLRERFIRMNAND